MTAQQTQSRAQSWVKELGFGDLRVSESTLGGGSLPGETLPTHVLSLDVRGSAGFTRQLRLQNPPIIARTESGRILLDPRTVLIEQDAMLLGGVRRVLQETQ